MARSRLAEKFMLLKSARKQKALLLLIKVTNGQSNHNGKEHDMDSEHWKQCQASDGAGQLNWTFCGCTGGRSELPVDYDCDNNLICCDERGGIVILAQDDKQLVTLAMNLKQPIGDLSVSILNPYLCILNKFFFCIFITLCC